jgi:peroxiredoxin
MRAFLSMLALFMCTAAAAVEPGQPAPAFAAPALQGQGDVELARYRGSVVLLDFWASWCGPCRQSLPAFERLRTELAPQGFEIVAVNVDENPRDGLDFLKKYPVTYPTVRDPQAELASRYGVQAMPSSYLIDRSGVVRAVKLGFHKNDMPKLRESISTLIREERP